MKMKQTTIVAIVLGVLILVSAVQAVQLGGLKSTIAEGNFNEVSSAKSSVPVASGGSGQSTGSIPSSIKDLPQMVGGC